jgi:UDP-glucose:(heptosyl)LPS alpha-1,3-glucosyltransferase
VRIALVVERLSRSAGGVERASWQVARALAAAGETVHVFCRECDAPPSGVTVVRVHASDLWQAWRVPAFSRRVARAIESSPDGFDVVHSFTRTDRQDVYRAGAGRHADYLRHTHGPIGAAIRRLTPRHQIALRADRRIFDDPAQWIQCPSALVRDALVAGAGIDPARTVVIPNGVDSGEFHPRRDAASQALRDRHAAPGETVWLFAGSGGRRKGLDIAIRSLARTRAGRAVLWVAGRDAHAPWRQLAQQLGVSDRVRFIGPRADMPDVYRAADGLFLPTRYDAFANASLEAAACGLAVISSAHNGAMEVIGDGGIALADPDDIGAAAAALDRLTEPAIRSAFAERSLARARQYDWVRHAERLREFYREVVARRIRAQAGNRT